MSDGAKILIADDEQDCIDFVREALADTPHEVIAAADGAEALKVAREQAPALIILDVQMPEINGFEVFRQLRADERLASVPVIMLTAVSERTGIDFNAEGSTWAPSPMHTSTSPSSPSSSGRPSCAC